MGLSTTAGLSGYLAVNGALRRVCAFPMRKKLQDESNSSRTFAEFAGELGEAPERTYQRWHSNNDLRETGTEDGGARNISRRDEETQSSPEGRNSRSEADKACAATSMPKFLQQMSERFISTIAL